MAEEPRTDESIANDTTEVASTDRSADSRSGRAEAVRDAPPSFGVGALVGERYYILRFLARGGMGEVYAAEDTTLHQRVALKAIAAEVAQDRRMIDRLKREVLLARKVTDANVCRLHDLGFHVGPSGTMAFLTMDLLRGETLASRIARGGRLSEAEALPLVKQMAKALDAAHAAGVIHRDLKSRNVMLVPDGAATRAVVMDFGIAVAAEEEERRALDTGEGTFVGTPAYMAPEQVSGAPVSPATDVYALGVVMFEMVTGGLPFATTKALETIAMRLTQPPPSPRSRVPSLDRQWERVILRCLERDPAKRYPSAGAAAAALDEAPPFWTRGRAIAAGALVAAGLAVAGVSAYRAPKPAAEGAPGEAKRRPTIAVLAMKNDAAAPDAAWLATAIEDSLATDLDADEELRVVPADRVARARHDLALGDEPTLAAGALAQVRENLGADYVLVGRYRVRPGGKVDVEVTLTDARSGRAQGTARASGDAAKPYDVVTELGGAIRKQLGARDPSAAQRTAARAASPGTPEAARAFADGEAKYRDSDYAGALASYEKAAQADPDFPLAHLGVAQAAAALGYDKQALEESRKAFEQSKSLSREQQLVVESRYRATAKEWDRATEIARTLYEFFPDNVDYGIRYVHALGAAGRSKDALDILAKLKSLPPPDSDDARLDLYEAIAYSKLSDFKRDYEAAKRAAEKATRASNEQVMADARSMMGEALRYLHRSDEAVVELETARGLYAKQHDREYEAQTTSDIAAIFVQRGDPARALPMQEQVLAVEKEIGGRYKIANQTADIAWTKALLGDTRGARAMYDEARGLWEAIHDREGVANAVAGIGGTKLDEGDLQGGRGDLEDGRTRMREVGGRDSICAVTMALADLAIDQGRFDDAEREVTSGAALAKELENDYHAARVVQIRARLARESGDLAAAKKLGDEALTAFRATQSGQETVQVESFLALVAIDDGHPEDAEAPARAAADAAHAGGMAPDEGIALAALATALAEERKIDDAAAIAARAAALGATRVATQIAIARARGAAVVAAGAGGWAQAQPILADARKLAESSGYAGEALEIRLALARGPAPGARTAQLAAVARDAAAKGFARIAKAARAPGGAK
jgi:TolB-like protein/tRNA A-37 threonylcarbamoyl transferase component Bud32